MSDENNSVPLRNIPRLPTNAIRRARITSKCSWSSWRRKTLRCNVPTIDSLAECVGFHPQGSEDEVTQLREACSLVACLRIQRLGDDDFSFLLENNQILRISAIFNLRKSSTNENVGTVSSSGIQSSIWNAKQQCRRKKTENSGEMRNRMQNKFEKRERSVSGSRLQRERVDL